MLLQTDLMSRREVFVLFLFCFGFDLFSCLFWETGIVFCNKDTFFLSMDTEGIIITPEI